MGEPLDYEGCNLYALLSLFLDEEGKRELQERYKSGKEGYGHIKKYLKELIWKEFEEAREKREYYKNHLGEVREILDSGAMRVKEIAKEKLRKVRDVVGILQ
jgi:tryptophanyl-tRNA synthetase